MVDMCHVQQLHCHWRSRANRQSLCIQRWQATHHSSRNQGRYETVWSIVVLSQTDTADPCSHSTCAIGCR